MTQSIVIRSLLAACAAAAVGSLCAQSAPLPGRATRVAAPVRQQEPAPPAAQEPKPAARAKVEADRVQVRLAEVMAMLEEDEMTPALQQKALAKLAEVAERLKKERAAAAAPPVSAPQLFVIRGEGDKVARARALGVPMPPEPPAAPEPPKSLVEVLEGAAQEPPARAERGKAFVAKRDYERRLRAEHEEAAAKEREAVREQEEARRQFERQARARFEAAQKQIEAAKERVEAVQEQQGDRSRVLLERLVRQQEAANADREAKALLERVRQLRAAAPGQPAAPDPAPRRILVERARQAREAAPAPAPAVRPDVARVRSRAAAPVDDEEIRATIEEMRAEMREIRKLMLEIRNRARAEEQRQPPNAGWKEVRAIEVRELPKAAPEKVRAIEVREHAPQPESAGPTPPRRVRLGSGGGDK